MPKIYQATFASLPIPLLPLGDQHRMVARVDEPMALCDRLEESLIAGDDTRATARWKRSSPRRLRRLKV
jgi:type I restriction enzyme, S subunit